MLKSKFNKQLIFTLCTLPISTMTMGGVSGEFVVGFGPVSLGKVIMTSSCEDDTCKYKTIARGSFLFVSADIIEHGIYEQHDTLIVPVFTSYEEEIGSKYKAYTYDFVSMESTNKKKKKQKKLEKSAYPFIPLLNQVALDLANGGMKQDYEYIIKQDIKPVIATSHTKTPVDKGTLHQVIVEGKEKPLEIYFVQNGNTIQLQKIYYGSFWLAPEK